MDLLKIIPFRLDSSRFPGKATALFRGRPILEHVLGKASEVTGSRTVLTSPAKDYQAAGEHIDFSQFDFEFIETSPACSCATERIFEISRKVDADYYMSIPVDEVALNPQALNKGLAKIEHCREQLFTFYCDFYNISDAQSELSAKMCLNDNAHVMYMSRSVIPFSGQAEASIQHLKKHVGVYVFKKDILNSLRTRCQKKSHLEEIEKLEQLRWIENGFVLKALRIDHVGVGIDNPSQIPLLEERMKCLQKQTKSE